MEEQTETNTKNYMIHVMFPDGTSQPYSVSSSSTVFDLIKLVQEDSKVTKPEEKTLSLIYRGRFLLPSEVFQNIEKMDEFSVQAYFKPIKKQENEEEPVELKGFDRISRMGYSPELISTIRTNFHTMNGTLDESDETRLNIEEEWFPVIFNQENPLDLLGIHTDNLNETTGILEPAQEYPRRLPSWLYLLIGFTLGTLFGFVSLIVLFVDMTNFFLVLGVFLGIIMNFTLNGKNAIFS